MKVEKIGNLLTEARQLTAIFTASTRTMRKEQKSGF